MTEAEWLACTDPRILVKFLHSQKLDRKLRLFSCAFCRSIWNLLSDDCFRNAVEVAERFADGLANVKELASAKAASGAALERSGLDGVTGPPLAAKGCAWSTTRDVGSAAMYPLWVFTEANDRTLQMSLLRDIFGNLFRHHAPQPSSVSPSVASLAQAIYNEQDFGRVTVLADALERAGCNDENILTHCRDSGPHVRGCWVIDLLLGMN
jgi:hypothetical protein